MSLLKTETLFCHKYLWWHRYCTFWLPYTGEELYY